MTLARSKPLTAGLTAGAVAAVVSVLVSLPLRSPSDALFNSASVALAALLAGAVAGLLRTLTRQRPSGGRYFLALWTALFVPAAVLLILAGQSQLDHFIGFAAPLSVIIFLVTASLTLLIPRWLPRLQWWGAALAVAAAIGLGLGLAEQGDQESGELRLPPPASRLVPGPLPPGTAGPLP